MHRLPAGQLAAALIEVLAQGHAVHILHDDILQVIVHRDIVHLDDVRVIQQRNGLGFVLEAAHKVRVVHELPPQHFDCHHRPGRHRAVVAPHDSLVDVRHAAGADQFLHLVQAVQPFADQVIHCAPPSVPR